MKEEEIKGRRKGETSRVLLYFCVFFLIIRMVDHSWIDHIIKNGHMRGISLPNLKIAGVKSTIKSTYKYQVFYFEFRVSQLQCYNFVKQKKQIVLLICK